jgi:hypothetical protein
MKFLILIGVGFAVLAPAAAAQTGGDGEIVGRVPSTLELALDEMPNGTLSAFAKPRTYSASIRVAVTSSEPATSLWLADGDVASGARVGHLTAGRRTLPEPLEASVKGSFVSLDTPVAPLLARWSRVLAREPATIRLRQRVTAKRAGTFRKVVLVTAAPAVP